ncbi:MAG: ATP-dependent Clp protease proteolytic subunit [Lachnospiraceae bacterium]|nr:ATP-dependent Clp protease proteolytic subunit [Lachnospiraceae bacterium]
MEVQSASGTRELYLQSRHFTKRNIFLNDEITSASADQLLMQMMYLDDGTGKPIRLYIDSPGGEVDAGSRLLLMQTGLYFLKYSTAFDERPQIRSASFPEDSAQSFRIHV